MKRCDKRDSIFANLEEPCASDEDLEKVLKNNVYMYYADNIVDFKEYSNYRFPYFKKNKALFYEHILAEELKNSYDSYQMNM